MSTHLAHTSAEFKKNEIKTLEFIDSRGFFNDDFPDLASSISIAYSKYRGVKGNLEFQFATSFEMEIEGQCRQIVLHAQAMGNYQFTSYSLGVCSNENRTDLIRRFHFDYVHKNGGTKQKVPISHMQYGGKSGNQSSDDNYKAFSTALIEDWLSEPRLYYPPINIAMLLDLVFTEFRSEKTVKITDSSEWRSLIRKNEVFIFKDYFKTIANLIDTERHKKELVRDIYYI